MKPEYRGPETEAEFVAEVEGASALLSHRIESVDHGWSLEGHWYVKIKTGADGIHGTRIVCANEKQARAISELLRPLVQDLAMIGYVLCSVGAIGEGGNTLRSK